MERVATGIKGFDSLIEGGFPKGSSVLLSGTPATGKTIFALEYLINGIKKFDEKGLYITFEEKESNLKNQALQFGWDLNDFEKKGKLIIRYVSPSEISKNTIKEMIELAKEHNIKRLVIDSLSTLSINTPSTYLNVNEMNEFTIKRFIYSFVDELKQFDGITSILISQSISDDSLSRDNVSEFICDGIVHLTFESMGGQFSRSLLVRKMRRTKNEEDIHPLEISKNGVVVHNIK